MNINDLVKTERISGVIAPQVSLKAQMGDLAWQELMRANEAVVPQSIAVQITYDGHVYRGAAYLVEEPVTTYHGFVDDSMGGIIHQEQGASE